MNSQIHRIRIFSCSVKLIYPSSSKFLQAFLTCYPVRVFLSCAGGKVGGERTSVTYQRPWVCSPTLSKNVMVETYSDL